MSVYELEDSLQGFLEFRPGKSLTGVENIYKDFDPENPLKLSWGPRLLADLWPEVTVRGKIDPYNDYPSMLSDIPIFSARAVYVLRRFLESSGELLPLKSKYGDFFAFNILKKSTAFDRSMGKADFQPETGKETSYGIDRYAFIESKLKNHSIFRIREYRPPIFVTDAFKDRAESDGLNGMRVIKVWPLSRGQRPYLLPSEYEKKPKITGQCLILRFPLLRKKPSAAESELVRENRSRIVSFLEKANRRAYVGMVEFEKVGGSEYQIAISCADADRSLESLMPVLQKLPWKSADVLLTKRYGHICISKAKSASITIEGSSDQASRASSAKNNQRALPIKKSILSKIQAVTQSALDNLKLTESDPDLVISRIDEIVCKLQRKKRTPFDSLGDHLDVVCAAVWGSMLIKRLGWEWKDVEFTDSSEVTVCRGVVSPDHSIAIYPFYFVGECFKHPRMDCTIELSYNMLIEKSHPAFAPKELIDFMDGVNRIIPKM